MNKIVLLLGSNLGEREYYMRAALNDVARYIGDVIARSEIIETAAWPDAGDPSYLNQVLVLSTELTPRAVLRNIMTIERRLGRHRNKKNAPRTIDIDILIWGDSEFHTPILTVPHPAIGCRSYVDELLKKIGI